MSNLFRTPRYCAVCGSIHSREVGYWFNAVVLNYIVSGLASLGLFFGVLIWLDWPALVVVTICAVVAVVVSILANPLCRTLWLASDIAASSATDDDFVQTYSGDDRRLRRMAAEAREQMLANWDLDGRSGS